MFHLAGRRRPPSGNRGGVNNHDVGGGGAARYISSETPSWELLASLMRFLELPNWQGKVELFRQLEDRVAHAGLVPEELIHPDDLFPLSRVDHARVLEEEIVEECADATYRMEIRNLGSRMRPLWVCEVLWFSLPGKEFVKCRARGRAEAEASARTLGAMLAGSCIGFWPPEQSQEGENG